MVDPAASRGRPRRLAVVDTRFPWKLSGFRYWEAVEIHRQRPDTLFFASEPWPDEFPAEAHAFADFPRLAQEHGVTDLYCVFLNLTLSLLGRARLPSGESVSGSNPVLDMASFLDARGIRVHATLYPGGGLEPETPVEFLRIAGEKCATIFTNVREVLEAVPGSIHTPVVINTDFYAYAPRAASLPIELTFSHIKGARKNFPMLARAFNGLDPSFHLNLVGNWETELHLLTNPNYTFFGILPAERLRELYWKSHVFIVCSTQDRFSVEGFPTTSGADAMSAGCLLLATNFRQDRLALTPGRDYLEVKGDDADSLREVLRWVRDNYQEAMAIASAGSATIRRLFDAKTVVSRKLKAMFE